MGYEHLVFDVDGTLLDNKYAILRSLQDTVRAITGRETEVGELDFALGMPGEATMNRLGIEDSAEANRLWGDNFMKYMPSVKLFDGIAEMLEELRGRGCRLGIITSKTRRELEIDFGRCGITSLFATIICVEDAPRPKPFADPMTVYIERTNAPKAGILYIGDTVYDALCAENAGVDFGRAAWGGGRGEDINAKYIFDTPQAIRRLWMTNGFGEKF